MGLSLPRTDTMLKPNVMPKPTTAALTYKNKHLELIKDVSIRPSQHRLQRDPDLPARSLAMEPLLTKTMKKRSTNARYYPDGRK